ncbi:MAG: 1-acyl-sn-glycerol-3-phosphate acyltransferase, partial [Pseudobdellovibrio sp.]
VAGCAYVDRKNRMKIQLELKDIIEVLKEGFKVVLYAESVASNGEQVLPFKKTLITAAQLAKVPIRPFVFNVRSVNGGDVKYEHRDSVCWYGHQSFFGAIWRSLSLDSVTLEIEFLSLVYIDENISRDEIAKTIHKMVADKYVPFAPNM